MEKIQIYGYYLDVEKLRRTHNNALAKVRAGHRNLCSSNMAAAVGAGLFLISFSLILPSSF